jgi:Tat protein translocase TatB subunit
MSISHLIVIAVIALIVLGPEKLPQVARMAGKALAELRRITGDFRSTVEGEMREIEREAALKELRQKFPEHVHYDLQEEREHTIAAANTAAPPAVPAPAAEANTEAATASGKPSNGEPNPA